MKLVKINSQHRRDINITIECENCGAIRTNVSAYDDRNYWDNVLPNGKCKSCGKSSIDIGASVKHVSTKYGEHEIV